MLHFGVEIVPTKFGSYMGFFKLLDLWMTFDFCWGRIANMAANLRGPTPMPSLSSIPQNSKKRIAVHIYSYFSFSLLGQKEVLVEERF